MAILKGTPGAKIYTPMGLVELGRHGSIAVTADKSEYLQSRIDAGHLEGYTIEPDSEPDGKTKGKAVFQGPAKKVVDAGDLGNLVFDDQGLFVPTKKQADWLKKAIVDKAESVSGVTEIVG